MDILHLCYVILHLCYGYIILVLISTHPISWGSFLHSCLPATFVLALLCLCLYSVSSQVWVSCLAYSCLHERRKQKVREGRIHILLPHRRTSVNYVFCKKTNLRKESFLKKGGRIFYCGDYIYIMNSKGGAHFIVATV